MSTLPENEQPAASLPLLGSAMANSGPRRATLVFIFITVVLDTIAFGIIIPVLPRLVEQLAGGDTAHAAKVYGLFGTAWALTHFLAAPIHGALSDRFGRRPLILLSCLGLGLDFVLMALAPSLAWLLAGRVLSGATAASFTVAGAYIADVTRPEKRASAFGLYGAAWGLGFILGPAIGGLLASEAAGGDPRLPFWIAAGMSFLNLIYGLFVLPESLPRAQRVAFSLRKANPFGSLQLLRSHRELLGLAGASTLHALAHHAMPSVFVLYIGYRFGWSIGTTGLALALVGVLSVLVQAGLIKPVVARFGERRALVAGFSFGAVGYALCGWAPSAAWFWAALVVFELIGLAPAALLALMSRQVGADEQGRLQGANTALVGLTGVIGPGLFTAALALGITDSGQGAPLPGAPFFIAALLTALAGWTAWRATRPGLPA